MLSLDKVKSAVHTPGRSRRDNALLLLACDPDAPKRVREIKATAERVGLWEIRKWNLSDVLASTAPLAIRTSDGWELSTDGRKHVATLVPTARVALTAADDLRAHLASVPVAARLFVEEAIGCFEAGLIRAAIVLSWVGAVSVLQDHVHKHHLAAFNAEAVRRAQNPKYPWKPAKSTDDLSLMKEGEFLEVLVAISIVGKNVKEELKKVLDTRNACGHPNSRVVGPRVAAAHVETLIQNVFTKF